MKPKMSPIQMAIRMRREKMPMPMPEPVRQVEFNLSEIAPAKAPGDPVTVYITGRVVAVNDQGKAQVEILKVGEEEEEDDAPVRTEPVPMPS